MVILMFILIWHQDVSKLFFFFFPPHPQWKEELIFLCSLAVRVEDAEHLTRSCSATTLLQVRGMILQQNWAKKKENQACNIPWGLRKFIFFPYSYITRTSANAMNVFRISIVNSKPF